MIYLALAAFVMMIIQSGLTYLQYKNYQKTIERMRKKGILLGVGLRKGGFNLSGGSIVILALDRKSEKISGCKKLEGISMWKRFNECTLYHGLSLSEIRELGIFEDLKINRRRREKEPYAVDALDKRRKKGALIQAVEALDQRLSREAQEAAYQKKRRDEKTRIEN